MMPGGQFRPVFAWCWPLTCLGGAVVHALRGERERYQPLGRAFPQFPASRLDDLVGHYRLREAYVADLDRITGTGDNLGRCAGRRPLPGNARLGHPLHRRPGAAGRPGPGGGAGVGDLPLPPDAEAAEAAGVQRQHRREGRRRARPGRRGRGRAGVALRLDALHLRDVLLLDLRRVGAEAAPTCNLAETVASATEYPVLVGGGVRGVEDLEVLEAVGAAGAVVATAAHRGAIPAERLAGEAPE